MLISVHIRLYIPQAIFHSQSYPQAVE